MVERVARALSAERKRVRRENDAALAEEGLWSDPHKQPTDEQYATAALEAAGIEELRKENERLRDLLWRAMDDASIEPDSWYAEARAALSRE